MLTQRNNGSNTKAGPGRIHVQGNGTKKTSKQRAAGAYGAGLMASWDAKRRDALHKDRGHSNPAWTFVGREVHSCLAWDEHGVPITGGRLMPAGCGVLRRVWLGGISAQRGY